MDNFNTYVIFSFYETIPLEEAFRLAQRLEIHHTPNTAAGLILPRLNSKRLRYNVWAISGSKHRESQQRVVCLGNPA